MYSRSLTKAAACSGERDERVVQPRRVSKRRRVPLRKRELLVCGHFEVCKQQCRALLMTGAFKTVESGALSASKDALFAARAALEAEEVAQAAKAAEGLYPLPRRACQTLCRAVTRCLASGTAACTAKVGAPSPQ